MLVNMLAKQKDTERDILDRAIEAVGREAGLRLKLERWEPEIGGRQIDALLRFEPGNQLFAAEIKKWAQHTNFGALINQVQQLPHEPLLIADYVNPNMAEKLRDQRVQFIDTVGNAYINQPQTYIFVVGKKPVKWATTFTPTARGVNRAFEPKGLMVVYAFLCNPDLVNAPYRQIAAIAGVAVGTVGWVLNGLKAGDYIGQETKTTERYLANYQGLLNRWVETYPEKLKPKLTIGQFATTEANWWEEIDIRKYEGYWGGEIAGAKYTNYLKPRNATVYLPKDRLNKFLRDARLRKVTNWLTEPGYPVEIITPFWPTLKKLTLNERIELVHPVLAYADLVASGDTRNIEVAQRIYEERLTQYSR